MRPRDRAALLLVALAVTFSVLAVGGAPRWAACIGAFLGIASAVPYVTSRRTASKPSPILLPLAVAAGLTALQLLPLPLAIAEQLVPAKLELVTANAAALDEPAPTWVMASYDPPATLVELAKLLGYLGLAYTCVRLATVRRARRGLATIVAGVATAAALITLAHHALGATSLYGLFTPEVKPHILGPLFGVNHLASLLSIATPIALALALASSGILRVGWLAAAATLAGTTLLTGSRGGAIGLVAGLVVALAILLVQRRAGTHASGQRVALAVAVPGAVVAICAVVLLAALTAGDVASDLSHTELDEIHEPRSKFQVWDQTLALITENRWLGVGKGGFESTFTSVSAVGDLTYSHVENDYLQVVVDWGLPGAALFALALLTAARAIVGRWRQGALEAGILGGLASLAVHDVADFSLELPGVAMLAISAAAALAPARLGAVADESGLASAAPRRLIATRGGAMLSALAVVVLATSPLGRTTRADAAIVGAATDSLTAAAAGWRRHPSDYILAGRVAEALFVRGDPRALDVIARALSMNPLHSGLHRLAGRILARSNRPSQAADQFAAAARWSVDVRPVVADILEVFEDPAEVARALPIETTQTFRILQALQDRPDAALAFALRVGELHPRNGRIQYLLARTALQAKRTDVAVEAGRAAWRIEPILSHATQLGLALAASGDLPAAISLLSEASERADGTPPERVNLLFTLVDLQLAAGQPANARGTLERAASYAGEQLSLQIAVHDRMATVEDRLGNRNQAAWEREEARRLRAVQPDGGM